MAPPTSCCTCATLLHDTKTPYDPSSSSEKPILFTRHLDCCQRDICAACQDSNPRFQTYCPFCQISTGPSALPKEGLRLPPSYTRRDPTRPNHNDKERDTTAPPSYDETISTTHLSSSAVVRPDDTPSGSTMMTNPSSTTTTTATTSFLPQDTDDTIHHVSSTDTLSGLSLAYQVPQAVLRRHNNLYSDTLLTARKWVLIPSTHYSGPSLSTPPDPAEEERKVKVRRWMVATKCADYRVAELYLKGADGDLDAAVTVYKDDEEWERKNPLKGRDRQQSSSSSSYRSRSTSAFAAGLVGQLSR